MRNNVMSVDTVKPQATVTPKAFHISAPSPRPMANGIIPKTVVRVVIKMGLCHGHGDRRDLHSTPTPRSSNSVV